MYDVAIIGGGPAGASAATFTARAGLQTLVVDADKSVTRRAMINNHLGLPDGITGPELVERGKEQATKAGAQVVTASVKEVAPKAEGFELRTDDGQMFEAKQVLLTVGVNVELAHQAGLETQPGKEPRMKEIVRVDADGRTNRPGIWAAGTAAGVSVHTIITAGDGARVAVNIISAQKGERHVDHEVLPANAPAH